MKKKSNNILCILAVVVAVYWMGSLYIDVYKIGIVGVLYEILWLPMLVLLFGIPLFCIIHWVRNKFSFKTVYPYIILFTVAVMYLLNFLT